jgi:hypothetical protein
LLHTPDATAGDHDACSLLAEELCGLAADAAGRAGHDADALAQAQVHGGLAYRR